MIWEGDCVTQFIPQINKYFLNIYHKYAGHCAGSWDRAVNGTEREKNPQAATGSVMFQDSHNKQTIGNKWNKVLKSWASQKN